MYASLKLAACTVATAIVFSVCPQTHAVVITATSSLPTVGGVHQVQPNTSFTVDLSLSGWDSNDGEVDGIEFFLDFDQLLFAYSSDAIATSGAFINDNQQSGASIVADANDVNVASGTWGFFVEDDTGENDPNTGATTGSGSLGSITFDSGSTLGTGSFSPRNATFVGPVDSSRFLFGGEITPSSLSFQGIDVEVVPEPSSAILFLGVVATGIFGAGRRGSRLAVAKSK